MTLVIVLLFVLGLTLLVVGAEIMIRGASRLATASGISPLTVGLTVVAFGTSAPELAITLQSTLAGQSDLALGNVVGSNIANILLILGLAALVSPLRVAPQILRIDIPVMIGVSALLLLLALDQVISRVDGAVLMAGLLAYIGFTVVQSRRASAQLQAQFAGEYGGPRRQALKTTLAQIGLIVIGLALLVVGANWLIDGAVAVAKSLGVGELIIGLTIVAVGTSLPEIAASVVASLRGERDIAIGNAVGSCIFNILSVIGVTGLLAPSGIGIPPAAIRFDLPVMLAVAVASLPIAFHGAAILRWEGALFVGYYVIYTLYLVLNATQHAALPLFSTVMWAFVLPLTAITLLVILARDLSAARRGRSRPPV
jgi:cation:H+ antiporter